MNQQIIDIDFHQIVPRCGGQREAFEELCCQLAHRTAPEGVPYTRLNGAGGDGGVECFADLPSGRVGWQAKYVFDINSLLAQATGSLTTALKIHPTLTRYVVCFPFDLTGPTERYGRSSQEKLVDWQTNQEKKAATEGRQLTIEAWPASKLRELLLQYDASGGAREFFFNQKILTNEWFLRHLEVAKKTAGPRYTPELNVKTNLWKWFAALGRTVVWSGEFKTKLRACRQGHEHLASTLHRSNPDPISPAWPEGLREDAQALVDDIGLLLRQCDHLMTVTDPSAYKLCVDKLNHLLSRLTSLESGLVAELEAQHGPGMANSRGFRQFMAEYMVSHPAANLDSTRDATAALRDLYDWLQSPACSLAYERVFVLSGVAGSGKTHGVCDAAERRFSEGLLTCVTFGHEFRGEPDPWTRLSEALALSVMIGMNGLLDALNAAGETSGSPLILCIDAINETRPLRYWRDRLSAFSQAVGSRPYLRLCITCRTSFLPFCLPDDHGLSIAEHTGFAGIERDACQAFFRYYELDPPIAPILQPEMSNPLYLRLVCENLRSRGLRRLPLGWHGMAPTIRAFLEEKERQFAAEYETSPGANIVGGSLMAISSAIAESGDTALSWSKAQGEISTARPNATTFRVLEWLVRSDLLLEDAPVTTDAFPGESVVRPAFERLGDFLVAAELLERCRQTDLDGACQPGGALHPLLRDSDALVQNSGVLAALSILVPEDYSGVELPSLVNDESIRASLVRMAVQAIPSRDPHSFTDASRSLIRKALGWSDFSFDAMDAVLAISWQPSTIDAIWLDWLLKRKSLAKRDAYWCGYLHERFKSHGAVRRLIDAAFELPLDQVEHEIAERWATVLLWFTAAADRRVKDMATRAAIAILAAQPRVLLNALLRLIVCDDDEVRERALLSCYGALIISRDTDVLGQVTGMLQEAYRRSPEAFHNALIRDHIRCISELARQLGALPDNCDPELTMQPIASEWPLELPSEDQVKAWGEVLHFKPDEFWSDFFKYSMNCLGDWVHAFPKTIMGDWILQRAARDFGYVGSGCEDYDGYMLGEYGGGRGKPTWAERIGKKYQWTAMYHLASRLRDHVLRKRDSWKPKPLQTQLILLEERKLDPTLPRKVSREERRAGGWWITASVDLGSTETLSDEEWVAKQEDIPPLEKLLSVINHKGQEWRLLVSYPSWERREEDADWNDPYRQVWMHIASYLVKKQEFATGYSRLLRRNFFGNWMPGGASWLYGFAGEYPWATPFNTEPEEWHGRGGHGGSPPVAYQPSWDQLAVEWEYDASIARNFHMIVPARILFSPGDLWWGGNEGYGHINGRTVFQDPSVAEPGPPSLIADAHDLPERLEKLGVRIIWTLLGEKWILGGPHDEPTPRRTFSQVACLNEDGSLQIGERAFFEDYGQDTGPLVVNRTRTGRSGPPKRRRGSINRSDGRS
jgi:hypothetical protein